ncbi:MAG: DegV family EDD domain-containing protein [Lachnospiraceae bacterium]|nr:DegV family EDD domain-containing protein [Lachnospiraceae bacterium]
MNRLKNWIAAIKDTRVSSKERLFRLMLTVGLTTLLLVGVVAAIIGEDERTLVTLFGGFFMLLFVAVLSFKFHKVMVGMRLVIMIMLLFVVPIGFFGGGVYGGGPIWFIFCYVLICTLMEGRERRVFYVLATVMLVLCYELGYHYPWMVSEHSKKIAYLDSFTSLLLLSVMICAMFEFVHYAYMQKSEHAKQQRQEIVDLNRAQNRFFSSMSHEIRTPINTIIGLNEMNLREELSTEVAENSLHIQNASNILLSLVNDILDMSRIESGKMTIVAAPYKVNMLLSEVAGMVWTRAKDKGLYFSVEVDSSMPSELIGDEVRIKQILINMLTNAIKYTEAGSVVLSIQCTKNADNTAVVSYSIADTGIGIKKENIPHLFSAFHRAEEGQVRYIEGTGLGLAIVRQLVDMMGGQITVNSIYTRGSTFVVTLPQQVANDAPLGEFNLSRRDPAERRRYKQSFEAPEAKVLLVDDNEVNLMVAEKLLRETKVQVEAVTSGADALRRTLERRYDVIFMDHLMPQMDGIECLHAIRAQKGGMNVDTPVIVLTANAGSDLMEMYRREGFDDCILKPVTGELLEEGMLAHLPRELVTQGFDETILPSGELPVLSHSRKRAVVVTTECVCDLPAKLLAAKQIGVLPYNIFTDEGYFMDGKEIESDGLLSYMIKSGKFATTRQPEVSAYESFFSEHLERATQVVHITSSKKMAASFGKAMEAARAFDNVTVIDSGHMSSGMGMMVLHAAKLAENGEPVGRIRQELEIMKNNVQTSFVLDSMKYLARSGRVPRRAMAMSEAFMLHPIVAITDGVMRPRSMKFGNRGYAWKRYMNSVFMDKANMDTGTLFIVYSGLPMTTLHKIEEEVEKHVKFDKVIQQKVSASSACMFGPGTFGLIYSRLGPRGEYHLDTTVREERSESSAFRKNMDAQAAQKKTDRYGSEQKTDAFEEWNAGNSEKWEMPEVTPAIASPLACAPQGAPSAAAAFGGGPSDAEKLPGIPDWLKEIDGLDVASGVAYCSTEENYLGALDIFYSTIPQKADEIEQLFNDGDIGNYTIKVHALKSSARLVGAKALSEDALALEMAGKEGRIEDIQANTGRLLADYRAYHKKLAPLSGADAKEETEKEPVPEEILSDAYRSMVEFVDQMDYNLTEMVIKSLEEYHLPDEDRQRMDAIKDALHVLDWDKIKGLLP